MVLKDQYESIIWIATTKGVWWCLQIFTATFLNVAISQIDAPNSRRSEGPKIHLYEIAISSVPESVHPGLSKQLENKGTLRMWTCVVWPSSWDINACLILQKHSSIYIYIWNLMLIDGPWILPSPLVFGTCQPARGDGGSSGHRGSFAHRRSLRVSMLPFCSSFMSLQQCGSVWLVMLQNGEQCWITGDNCKWRMMVENESWFRISPEVLPLHC